MEPVDYLRILRRRWAVVAGAAMLAALAAFLTTSGAKSTSLGESYQATSILVDWVVANPGSDVTGNGFGTGTNLDALATLAKLSDVADRAAERMGFAGDPADLADDVTFEADSTAGLFKITADGDTPKGAENLANAYAGALVEFMADGIRQATVGPRRGAGSLRSRASTRTWRTCRQRSTRRPSRSSPP